MIRQLLVLDLVCLTLDHVNPVRTPNLQRLIDSGYAATLRPPFPAVTCTSQATMTTGTLPREHGVVCNGMFERDRFAVRFWDQPTSMVKREKVWEMLRRRDPSARTALLFFQNTMFASADVVVTPAPIHLDEGLVPWCYSKPVGFYERLAERHGPFELPWYWGPLAGVKSSQWIAQAALDTLAEHDPTLTLVYLPHLDYNTQRFGPASAEFDADLRAMDQVVGMILAELDRLGRRGSTAVVVVSEYAMSPVSRFALPNRALREQGLLDVRVIGGREYLDLELSRAFAMVDHQVAHVYVQPGFEGQAADVLRSLPGVERVVSRADQPSLGIDHPSSGDLIAIAEPDAWFAYYWWLEDELAPPYAREVDIHRKPAYDPCELFFDPATRSIPLKPALIRGSHGRPHGDSSPAPALIVSAEGARPPESGVVDMRDLPQLMLDLLGYGG